MNAPFPYPKIGAAVRIHPKGFDPARVGIYQGVTEQGELRFDTDPLDLLPDDHPGKTTILPPGHAFEVLA